MSAAQLLLAELVDSATRRAAWLADHPDGPIAAAQRDALRAEDALLYVLLLAMTPGRISVDVAAEEVSLLRDSPALAASARREALREVRR